MNKVDFEATIQQHENRNPFRPFTIVLTCGDRIHVQRPQELASHQGKAAHVPESGDLTLFDYHNVRRIEEDS